jgi:hypothetical protein
VRQKLFLVDRRDHLDRLDLHDHKVLHDQICPKSRLNPCALIDDGTTCCRATRRPRFSNSNARTASQADSSRPGPRLVCTR